MVPTIARDRLEALLARAADQNVVVVGDAMLDVYLRGDVDRISPEAPVPVVRVRAVVPSSLEPVPFADVAELRWDRTRLERAIAAAERARRRSIRPCAFCGDPTPPEHGERDDEHGFVCHGCMSGHLGVVF